MRGLLGRRAGTRVRVTALAIAGALAVGSPAVGSPVVGSLAVGSPVVGSPVVGSPVPASRLTSAAASIDACPDGRPECVDGTIAELRERFAVLGQGCDHHATFTLAYLRTTQGFKWGRDQDGFFADNRWVNHEGAVFAEYYYRAYDDWVAGRRSAVPVAWLAALDAALARRITGPGDLMLGMNAHINRDLPYVLEAVGLTAADGSSRKPDHDKVNEILAAVMDPILAELITRFDPDGFDAGITPSTVLDLIVAWREQAWRNAVRLTNARTPFARALVVLDIESTAAATAAGLATLTSYVPPFTGTGPRDAHCAAHHADPPPLAYPFGLPPAY